MSESRGRTVFTLLLVLGAVSFGMVLAGGSDLTPAVGAAPPPAVAPVAPPEGAAHVSHPGVAVPSFADLADAVSPAVAFIEVETIESRRRMNPLDFLFRQRRGPRGEQRQPEPESERRESSGSGFVISPDGLVVTNYHVIENADQVKITVDGHSYPAEIQGTDPATDLALLSIDAERTLPYLALGDSDSLRPGDWIMVIGSPLQLENSVSVGVVSAKGRSINITRDSSLENFIQTDAAINFGNSGGPLVDTAGRVVGIATAINYGAENIGFAVPIATLERILPQLRETGTVKRGYLGVTIATVDDRAAPGFGLKKPRGVYAQGVVTDGPADHAGLQHGDIIFQVDGHEVADTRTLIDYVSSLPPGKKVDLLVYRDGEELHKRVTLGERTISGQAVAGPDGEQEPEGQEIEWLGLQYQDLTPADRENHGLPEDIRGVWVSGISPTSPLADQNVIPGDIISEVNGKQIDSVGAFESAVASARSGSHLRLYIRRIDPRSGQQTVAFFAFAEVP